MRQLAHPPLHRRRTVRGAALRGFAAVICPLAFAAPFVCAAAWLPRASLPVLLAIAAAVAGAATSQAVVQDRSASRH